MNGPSSDRNLLLGIVALQMDFIGRDELIKAMHDWTLDKSRSLCEILVQNDALDQADRAVLESLVERHIARHGGDPEKSLSSLDLLVPSRSTLESLDDPDILQSLSKLGLTHTRAGRGPDLERTGSWCAPDDETAGRFRIISLHDEGGLGSVFLARDGEVNRDVALKTMKEEIAADPQYRARFVFEAEITGNLEHPGIVPVYGKGEYADGRPYYAMRFIRGDNLKVAVDRFHKDPELASDSSARQREFQKLLRRFLVVCETMSYAHSRGVIHRDLKPRNILLGPYGETLVVDWGLAKVVGHAETTAPADETLRPPSSSDVQATTAGSRVGTPSYMSPEQARGDIDSLGPAADIYSLGATLYYLLTKQAPFNLPSLPELLQKVERGEFPGPREVKPGVSRALEAICLKAMKTRPEDRYASCRDLGDDLEHWLADQPVSAYSEPLPGVVIRWGRRHKPLVGSIGALFFMSVVGLGLHDWRLGQEKGRVETALEQVRQEHIATGQARDEAARHLETTRKALRRQFNLAATSLATFPKTEGLRENLARELLDSYRPLLKTYPDDPNLVFEAGESYRILGTICRRTGKGDEALSLYQTSLKLFESILDHPARKFPARRGLANVLMDLGELHQANGSRSLAEQEHRRASEQVLKLDDDPIRAYYLKYKSSSLITLSGLVRERGAFEESRTLADQAVKLLEKPLEKPPPWWRDQDRWLLALAVYQRGLALRDLKNGASAHNDFDRAQLVARAIPVDSPFYTDAQYAIAMVLVSAAEKPAKPGLQATDMAALLDQAIPMLQNLVRDAAEMPHFREGLCHAFAERCQIMIALNRDNEAAKDCAHALVLANELHQFMPDNPGYLSLLGRATALEGRVAKLRVETGLAQRRLTESVGLLKQALQRDPDRYFDRVRLEALETELVAPARSAPKDQGALP